MRPNLTDNSPTTGSPDATAGSDDPAWRDEAGPMQDLPDDAPAQAGAGMPTPGLRRSRRLSDKILMTFHAACDVREFNVAKQLLGTLEWLLRRSGFRSPVDRRRNMEALVAAHERLWSLIRGNKRQIP